MRLLIVFIFLVFSYSLTFGQTTILDINLDKKLMGNDPKTCFTSSEDGQILYGFFSKTEKGDSNYEMYAFDKNLKQIQYIETINIGPNRNLRDIYLLDNNIITARGNQGYYSYELADFYVYKTPISDPENPKYVGLEFGKKEQLLAANELGDKYYVITLNKEGIIKIYTVDVVTLKYTQKEIEGNYKTIYTFGNSPLESSIGFTQIDNDKYYDLQAVASKVKSYFDGHYFYLETFRRGYNLLRKIDLRTGEISETKFENLYQNRTSVLYQDKYYVSEADGFKITLKIFDAKNGQRLNTYFCDKSDEIISFQSTKIIDRGEPIKKTKSLIKKLSKTINYSKSYGLIPEEVDSTVILTIGMPYYNKSLGAGYMTASGTYMSTTQSEMFNYQYGELTSSYYDALSFETWINPDGTIIPYDNNAVFISNYEAIFRMTKKCFGQGYLTPLSAFLFNDKWYFCFYDRNNKKCVIENVSKATSKKANNR